VKAGLTILHRYGIIHRDISVGVLAFDGGGKLCDLEYARDMGDESFHDIRTYVGISQLSLLTQLSLVIRKP
jgi:hypothetical protein